jgi:phage tail sheath protein FI
MSAQTLADPDDEELREIGARRLLCLLRRIALLHGPRWVFEPLGDDLRRRVERGFEAVLALLYRRGAFRGATARQAYRVDVSAEGPVAGGEGRLLCSIRVAPSLPLEFLTVRLIGAGDGRIVVEGP